MLQTSTPKLALSETQQAMYALDLQPEKFKTSVDDAVNLERIPIADCGRFKALSKVVSTYDYENMCIVDSPLPRGPKIVTFAHVLRYNTFPLAPILKELMEICKAQMNCDIEIEFAAELSTGTFNALQVRPISSDVMQADVDWKSIDCSGAMVYSGSALGTGWINGLFDVVYLKADAFDKMKTEEMAAQLRELNAKLRTEGRQYVLIGQHPDPWRSCFLERYFRDEGAGRVRSSGLPRRTQPGNAFLPESYFLQCWLRECGFLLTGRRYRRLQRSGRPACRLRDHVPASRPPAETPYRLRRRPHRPGAGETVVSADLIICRRFGGRPEGLRRHGRVCSGATRHEGSRCRNL